MFLPAKQPMPDTEEPKNIHFSPREKDVLPMLLKGYSSKEIARSLGISHRTVDIYRAAILGKVRVRKTAQLHYALQNMSVAIPA